MVDAFAEIEDSRGDMAVVGEGCEFVFEQAVFDLLPGYPAGMEAKHIQNGQEEEKEPGRADNRVGDACEVEEPWWTRCLGVVSQ